MFSETACRICSRVFRKRRMSQRYCSYACRSRAYDQRNGRLSKDARRSARRARHDVFRQSRLDNTDKRRGCSKKIHKNNELVARLWPSSSGISGRGLAKSLFRRIVEAELHNVPMMALPTRPNEVG